MLAAHFIQQFSFKKGARRARRSCAAHCAPSLARSAPMLNLLTDYHETTVEYEGQGDERIRQVCLGWSMGGCDTVWADVLQRILCRNGRSMVGDCTVLELGAGCGQLGLLAANWATRVDITDGDEEEVTLIGVNIEQHSPAAAGAELRAVHLDWSRPKEAEGRLLGRESYDVILASQVSYIPAFIPDLARTIRHYLSPGGTAYLYNDQVARMPLGKAHARSRHPHRRASPVVHPWQVALHGTTQAECRALLDRTLLAEGLHAQPLQPQPEGGNGPGSGLEFPPEAVEVMRKRSASYLLRITRDVSDG